MKVTMTTCLSSSPVATLGCIRMCIQECVHSTAADNTGSLRKTGE